MISWRLTMMASLVLASGGVAAQGTQPAAAKPQAAPAAAKPAAPAAGGGCKLEISGNDLMQFDKKELRVSADCATVELTMRHAGKLPAATMGHNWVLARAADADAVAKAGLAAGLKNNHVATDDARVLAKTKVIGGGQSETITFSLKGLQKGGDYTYVCTFPGHSAIMRGKFVIG
jgi:azurin